MAGGHGEGEHGADLVEAAHLQLPEPTHRLAPAEAFLNSLAQPLADRIAGSPRPRSGRRSCASLPFLLTVPLIATCASILARLQALDEGLDVVVHCRRRASRLRQSLAQGRRRIPPFPWPKSPRPPPRARCGLPQRIAEIGKTALLSVAFADEPRVLVRRRGVRCVRALRLAEVRFAVAPRRRRRTRAVLGPKLFIDAKALSKVPSTEKGSALNSPFTSGRPMSDDRNPCATSCVTAVLGEGRRVENPLVDRQPDEPAKQHVELQPFGQLPLRDRRRNG